LVSISRIAGVSLTGGQQYFMILGPLGLSDNSLNELSGNSQGLTGVSLFSSNGGDTWGKTDIQTLGAFDVLGTAATPEPGTLVMLGSGLLALGLLRKRLHR
jgi:hypothetical protein